MAKKAFLWQTLITYLSGKEKTYYLNGGIVSPVLNVIIAIFESNLLICIVS